MPNPPIDILFHWLHNTPEILAQLCVVVVVAYLAIRIKFVRDAIKGSATNWQFRVVTVLFFSVLAILGTLNGIVVDINKNGQKAEYPVMQLSELGPTQAVIGFRDTMVLSAGLCAGPWVGLGAGLVAGYHRYSLHGLVDKATGIATLTLGLIAGFARLLGAKATNPSGTLVVALVGTIIHRLILLQYGEPQEYVVALTWETLIPVTAVNCLGCLLFRLVIKDLEQDRLQLEVQQAQLRVLQAQIEPHFIGNTLNTINALIDESDTKTASDTIVKLAQFLNETRDYAKLNTIPIQKELDHLGKYIAIQELRFPGTFHFQQAIPDELLNYPILPRSLLSLVENALIHGKRGHQGILTIALSGKVEGDLLLLTIRDNGCGIAEERLKQLGKQAVDSERGSGNGLHLLCEGLRAAFGNTAKLDIKSIANLGTELTLKLPKETQS